MHRETVLYFEDDTGYGRIAREQDGYFDDNTMSYCRTTDRLLIERYDGSSWTETEDLGEYTDPSDLDVPKP